jgi:hypothetical protein
LLDSALPARGRLDRLMSAPAVAPVRRRAATQRPIAPPSPPVPAHPPAPLPPGPLRGPPARFSGGPSCSSPRVPAFGTSLFSAVASARAASCSSLNPGIVVRFWRPNRLSPTSPPPPWAAGAPRLCRMLIARLATIPASGSNPVAAWPPARRNRSHRSAFQRLADGRPAGRVRKDR